MAVIVTRAGKGSPLTNNEVDANFVNLNTELGLKALAGANSDITSMSGLTGAVSSPLSIQFGNGSAVTVAAGKMWYNNTTGSMNVGMGGGNITQQIGEELFEYGKASAAITDSPLQIVYQTGTVGASGVITFAPSVAGITNGDMIIGVATENIALNAFGRITAWGIVHGITTDGVAYGETWADNDTIWYNPVTGNPTKVKPVAPNIKVALGTVVRAGSGGSGSFKVEVIHGSVLGGTDSNVQLTSEATNDILQRSASGYWVNVTPATARTNLGLAIGTNVQAWGADLDAIEALAGTSGFLKKTAANTWALDTSTYLTTAVTSAVAGTGVSVSGATGAVTFSIGQAVATSSNVQFNSLGVGTAGSGTAGEIRATNNITAYYSDVRLKTKIGDIVDPLGQLRQIETMIYHANETAVALGYDASIIEVGLNAQSVQKVQPYTVAPAPIDPQYLTVRYERLVPLLIESVKALDAIVAKLVD